MQVPEVGRYQTHQETRRKLLGTNSLCRTVSNPARVAGEIQNKIIMAMVLTSAGN